jgi:hypothetical protein
MNAVAASLGDDAGESGTVAGVVVAVVGAELARAGVDAPDPTVSEPSPELQPANAISTETVTTAATRRDIAST